MLANTSIHLVTNRELLGKNNLSDVVAIAVKTGIDYIQIREKNTDLQMFIEIAREAKSLLRGTKTKLIINDNIHVAKAVSADGIHLGQNDLDVISARNMLTRHAIIGLTVETLTQAAKANDLPVDYLGISTIYPSETKTNAPLPWPVEDLVKLTKLSQKTLIGIGGITDKNATQLFELGLHGIAVVSYLCCDKPLSVIEARALKLKQLVAKQCQKTIQQF